MADFIGTLKFFLVLAVCGTTGYAFWITLTRGHEIAGMGREQVREAPVAVSRAENTAAPLTPPSVSGHNPRSQGQIQQTHSTAMVPKQQELPGGVYKSVDEKGTIQFSDRPISPGAQKVAVEPLNTVRSFEPGAMYAEAPPKNALEALHALPQEPQRRSRPTSADYQVSLASAFQKSRNELVLSGRVAGPACKNLRIQMKAKSSNGERVHATAYVNGHEDFGSSLFEATERVYHRDSRSAYPRWNITDVLTVCIDSV